MAIRTGIGIGAAQVADTSNILNAYGRQIAQQQKTQALQAEKEAKAAEKYDEKLADIMVGLKTTGARERDIPEIMASWREVKDFHEKSANIKESQRPLFMSTLKNMVNTVNDSAIRSKDLQSRLYSGSSIISQNPWDYDPKVFKDIEYINNTPISKLGAMSNFNPLDYQKLPNFGVIDNIIDKTYKLGEENAKLVGEVTEKGKRRIVSRVGEDVIKDDLIEGFTSSPEAMKAINYRYSKDFGKQPTDQELTNYIMDKYKTKYGFDYFGEWKDPKEVKEAKELDNEDVYAGWLKGAFTKDKASSLKNLRSVAGTKVTIVDKPDGTYEVVYKPMIDVGRGGVPIYIESPEPKTVKAANAGELAGVLRDAGVTGAGSKLISKVGGADSIIRSR